MTVPVKILIVDDETEIRRFLTIELARQNYAVETAETAYAALKIVNAKPPDVIILDLGLPDIDGQKVLEKIREWSSIPIIVLSARHQENEKIMALEKGADDYLTKPFSTGELVARIKVALRHKNTLGGVIKPYEFRGLFIDLDKRVVKLDSASVQLTPTEFKLIAALAAQPGKVVTHDTLINQIWGRNHQGNGHYLRIYIQRLREKFSDDPLDPKFIFTESGIGYRLLVE